MSKQMKLECCLFSIDLNQLITAVVFFHWLKLRFFAIVLVIRSRIFLLTLPPGPRGVVESAHGLTENNFKTRYRNHTSSFRHAKDRNSTELSKHIWTIKDNNIEHYFLTHSLIILAVQQLK